MEWNGVHVLLWMQAAAEICRLARQEGEVAFALRRQAAGELVARIRGRKSSRGRVSNETDVHSVSCNWLAGR